MATLMMEYETGNRILSQVGEGMAVLNSKQEKIGKVEAVYLGEVNEEERKFGLGPASVDEEPVADDSFMALFADIFAKDRIPHELVERLRYSGFIRVNVVGFFGADRFVTPDQIEQVDKAGVHLKVPEADRTGRGDATPVALL